MESDIFGDIDEQNVTDEDLLMQELAQLSAIETPPTCDTSGGFYDDDPIIVKPLFEENKISDEPISVSLNFLFDYLQLKNVEQEIPCTISLLGPRQNFSEIQKNRVGLDLICVVDVSGSMSGDKISLVKKTLEFLLTVLSQNDRVSIITFSSDSKRIIKLTNLDEQGKINVENAIKTIHSTGSTQIVEGLDKGLRVIKDRRIVNHVTSLLLLSDGVDNNSFNVSARAKERISYYKIDTPFTIHTFGYGSDHDAKIMREIAENNHGNFYYVENPKNIPTAFASCLGELVSLVADKITVSLVSQPCSIPFSLHKVYSENGDINFSMPQLYSGDKKDAVFTLKFPANINTNIENEIIKPVKAIINYEDKSGKNITVEKEIEILVTGENREEIQVNQEVMVNFYRCKGAEILKEIANLAENGSYSEARNIAVNTAKEFKECLVCDHPILKAIIKDLEDAGNRASSRHLWENGGRAQVTSVQKNHFCQKAASNNMEYMNEAQEELCDMAMDFFAD